MLQSMKIIALGATALMLSACGDNSLSGAFKNVSIKNIDLSGNAVVELKTEVGSANVIFSAGSMPIVDPKTGKHLGTISMERTLDGKNVLTVQANITGIKLSQPLADNKLPNGANVPVAGLTSLIAVPAGQHSRVYIGEAQDKMVFGVAVAVEQFDSLASYIPGASVFFNLGGDTQIKGLGGFFTSNQQGKSGLAIFAQTQVPALNLPIPVGTMAKASISTQSTTFSEDSIRFITRQASYTQANYFGYFLNRWNRSGTQLKVK